MGKYLIITFSSLTERMNLNLKSYYCINPNYIFLDEKSRSSVYMYFPFRS